MRKRRFVVLLVALALAASTAAAPASAARRGAPVRGALSGSGESTIYFVSNHPIWSSTSEGTLRATAMGPATYRLTVAFTGVARYATLDVAAPGGTFRASGGPEVAATLDTPLPIVEGTGRFSRSSGTVTIHGYAKTGVECIPSPPAPAPNLFCDWDETAALEGRIDLR